MSVPGNPMPQEKGMTVIWGFVRREEFGCLLSFERPSIDLEVSETKLRE
jgi:hypothetical protein